jgi:hypothetical protein
VPISASTTSVICNGNTASVPAGKFAQAPRAGRLPGGGGGGDDGGSAWCAVDLPASSDRALRPHASTRKTDGSYASSSYRSRDIYSKTYQYRLPDAGDREEKVFALRALWNQIGDHVKQIEDMVSVVPSERFLPTTASVSLRGSMCDFIEIDYLFCKIEIFLPQTYSHGMIEFDITHEFLRCQISM